MPAATTTLSTTTLMADTDRLGNVISVASTSGLTPGTRLYIDRELLSVTSLGLVNGQQNYVNVKRGVDGTHATRHHGGAVVTIGRADQFYQSDPQGEPYNVVLVSPHINVLTGDFWVVVGDDEPANLTNRWWAKQVATHGTSGLGVRTVTTTTQDTTQS